MATQATRIIEVHPWGTGCWVAPQRRRAPSIRVLPARAGRDVVGGIFLLGSAVALWSWFLAATW